MVLFHDDIAHSLTDARNVRMVVVVVVVVVVGDGGGGGDGGDGCSLVGVSLMRPIFVGVLLARLLACSSTAWSL